MVTKAPDSAEDVIEDVPGNARFAAIQALLTEPSIVAAAKKCGKNERTIRRWLAEDAAFVKALLAARRAVVAAGNAHLAGGYAEAAEQLLALMKDPEATSPRVSAAKAVLEHAQRGIEVDDMAVRIAALEQREQERGGRL